MYLQENNEGWQLEHSAYSTLTSNDEMKEPIHAIYTAPMHEKYRRDILHRGLLTFWHVFLLIAASQKYDKCKK